MRTTCPRCGAYFNDDYGQCMACAVDPVDPPTQTFESVPQPSSGESIVGAGDEDEEPNQ